MARDKTFKLQEYSTLDLTEEDGDTTTAVAGINDVTIEPNFSMERLYTADSVIAADRMQYEFAVNVEIGYAFFDGDVVSYWLNGSGGAEATSVTDTSDPQTFQLEGTFVSSDASMELNTTIEKITFESMPILSASQGEFAQWDLQGTGENLSNFDVSAPA